MAMLIACSAADATVLRNLDFQTNGLLDATGHPFQWDNYNPGQVTGDTSGITLGSPGLLPAGYKQAAHFQPALSTGRPRSQAVLAKNTRSDPGISAPAGPRWPRRRASARR